MEAIETSSLGTALPEEIERVRKIRDVYLTCPGGEIAAMMMLNSINFATKALAEGDAIACIQAYEDLKEYAL